MQEHPAFRPSLQTLLTASLLGLLCTSFLLHHLPRVPSALPAERNLHAEAGRAAAGLFLADTLLPMDYNHLFAGSGACQQCHGLDTLGIASVDADGKDVNVVDDWRATMMANSARDPFWRATVTHEVSLHPQHQAAIEDKCTSCHAPMGHFNAKHLGATHYLLADALQDALALDGVSCLACHQQDQASLGLAFSGQLDYDTFKVAYGPYVAPLVSPMLTQTGYKPKHSPFMDDAEQCAACHTLVTETIGPDGNLTGQTFVEQATYHEWLNSAYAGNQSCQGCHMPNLDKHPVHLVTGAQTEPRNPFYLHELVGANVTMLRLLRDNVSELGLKASPGRFDEVIATTLRMLQDKTLDLSVELAERTADSATFLVRLRNKAGHKFPSGYPSRRAVLSFLLRHPDGDTLFHSGRMDGTFEVVGHDPDFEPHHQLITDPEQVQIYEQVLGDVDGQVTTVLVRAAQALKDNRLPPVGFTSEHPAYDTTRITGKALEDPDFNRENGGEGSGTDTVRYRVALAGDAQVAAEVQVYYQSTPPRWMAPLLAGSTPAIDQFRTMFEAADQEPVLVQSAELAVGPLVATPPQVPRPRDGRSATVFPRLSPDGLIHISATFPYDMAVYDLSGRLVHSAKDRLGTTRLSLDRKGVFLVVVGDGTGWRQVEKVLFP